MIVETDDRYLCSVWLTSRIRMIELKGKAQEVEYGKDSG